MMLFLFQPMLLKPGAGVRAGILQPVSAVFNRMFDYLYFQISQYRQVEKMMSGVATLQLLPSTTAFKD